MGYVKDDEKDDLDSSAMLDSIKKGTEYANEQRPGPPMHIIGWELEPRLMRLLRLTDSAAAFANPEMAIPPAEIMAELKRRREARENTPDGCRARLEQAVQRRGMVLGHTDPVNEALALTVHQQGEDALAGDDFEKMRIALAALDQFEHRAQ